MMLFFAVLFLLIQIYASYRQRYGDIDPLYHYYWVWDSGVAVRRARYILTMLFSMNFAANLCYEHIYKT